MYIFPLEATYFWSVTITEAIWQQVTCSPDWLMEIAGFALYWAKMLLGLNYFLYKYECVTLASWPFRPMWLKGLGFLITPAIEFLLWWKRQDVYFSSRSIFPHNDCQGHFLATSEAWEGLIATGRRSAGCWEVFHTQPWQFWKKVSLLLIVPVAQFILTGFCNVALDRNVISQQRGVLRTVFNTMTNFTSSPTPPTACDIGSLNFKVLLCWVGMWPNGRDVIAPVTLELSWYGLLTWPMFCWSSF